MFLQTILSQFKLIKLKQYFLISLVVFFTFQMQFAQATSGFTTSLEKAGGATGHTKSGKFQNSNDLYSGIGDILAAALSFVGIILLVLIIYGGFIWMIARGNEQEAKRAQQILQMAIIGMIIIFAAYAISSFVINAFSV